MNAWAGLSSCCVFLVFQLWYFFPAQSTMNYRERYRISSSGEMDTRFLGGSCDVMAILIRQILYQRRVTVISIEMEDLKLKSRHHQSSCQTGWWFKDNTLELILRWSSPLDPSVCVDVKDKQTRQFSHMSPFHGRCCLVHWRTCGHNIFYVVRVT